MARATCLPRLRSLSPLSLRFSALRGISMRLPSAAITRYPRHVRAVRPLQAMAVQRPERFRVRFSRCLKRSCLLAASPVFPAASKYRRASIAPVKPFLASTQAGMSCGGLRRSRVRLDRSPLFRAAPFASSLRISANSPLIRRRFSLSPWPPFPVYGKRRGLFSLKLMMFGQAAR